LTPAGPPKFIPKINGFKIFGMRGSKYELKFDFKGQAINEEEIRSILKREKMHSGPKSEEEKMVIN
jgi:hypothetical protein